ncbi:hypothetical protein QRD40_10870 [Comamonas sp. Y6]|uniref:Uncharacterized protein n=1 Tax=Comamonas resistens TaxID=3046670 RepID=A0ABY8SW59_9BURK|nr:hypothetical protein [Comamonas resistens]MDL5036848.1 hypothetical protein [Comamonas resistens]WHS67158.1 hypothetical protein QMY55_08585 [Comamonas resistens]
MCTDCRARQQLARDALYRAKVGEALGHIAKGAAEMAGLKQKTGAAELAEQQAPRSTRRRKKGAGPAE